MEVQRQITVLQQYFSQRPFFGTALISSTCLLLAWSIRDYRQFKKLGRGGVPYNVFGWLIVTLLLRPLSLRKDDTTKTDDYDLKGTHLSQGIVDLPTRAGGRASVGGIVPHRQLSGNAPESMRQPLHDLFFKDIMEKNPTLLETRVSHYERHNPALYVHSSIMNSTTPNIPETAIVSQGEIGHVHPDLSIHLYFSEADAKMIMEKGWGERHRLARKAPWYYPGGKFVLGIGPTYVLISGPRDETEFKVVKTLLRTSADFMIGGRGVVLE